MRSKITFFSLLAVLFFIPKVSGQCTTGSMYPPTSFTPACSGAQETINTDCWAGEYAEVNAVANKQYTFASSTATDYITITDATGTVLYANGTSPVVWSSGAVSGVIHYFIHKNSACTAENVGRIRFITCATPVVTCTSPTGLFVSNITSNSARVNWTAPASVPSTGYDYYINTTNVAPAAATTATGTVANTLIATNISGMTASTTYYYWIRSNCNSTKGNWVSGGNFATIAFQNCNGASYGLYPDTTYTPSNTGSLEQIVTDTWAGEYTNVNITTNRQYTFTSSVSTDYITITNATGTVVYATGTTPLVWNSGATTGVIRYYMHANSACADDSMGRVRYITSVLNACTAPNTIYTNGLSSTGVAINWSAPGTPSNGYDYIVTASNATPTNASTPTGSTPNTVTAATINSGLIPNTTYYTWVRSNCGATKSSWFGPFLFVTLPTGLGNGCTSGALYPSTVFSPSCSGNPELITNLAYAGEYSNVSVANGRRLTFTSSNATDFITITNTGGTQILAYGITPVVYNVENGATTLRYYIHTGTDCGTETIDRDRYITCSTTVCPSPASPVSSAVTSSGALLSWTPTTSPGLGYEYYISTSNVTSPQYDTLATGTSATTSKTISNLNATTTYYFWVRSACTVSSKSNWISGGSFTTLGSIACSTPTNLSVSDITSNSAILNFTEANPAPSNNYQYYVNVVNIAPTVATTPAGTIAAGQANIVGLNASQTYFYWIRSNCGTSQSAWVAGGSFTTVAALSCNGTAGNFGLYPSGTFTSSCDGSAEVIANDSWAGEFCKVSISSGRYYTFTSSIPTDYITITNATGNVVYASGITPLVWNSSNNSGVIRYFIHSNASCGTEQTGRTRSITCTPFTISIVGDAASGWDNDINLSTTDGVIFTLNNYTLTTGGLKFRLNGNWNVNWGSFAFPNGTGFQDGPNIPVVACIYNITFNSATNVYSFVSTSTQPTAPTGTASQAFCNSATVANLVATGTNIKWYDASMGGNLLVSTTPLVSGTTYYASRSNGTCESVARLAVTATINVTPAPTVPPTTQTFCLGAIVGNLVATGTSKKWYTVPVNGSSLPPAALLATGTYYVTQTLNSCESARTPVNVVVNPLTAPTFTAVAPICSGATLTALPTTSNNAITGTWSPALNNTATTTYTFTPGTGQCASTATMTITVNQKVTPTFTQVAAICSGATLSALPVDSTNGINGSWSPALNNTATTTYTFTPSVGQCANTATMTITVNQKVTPTFTQVAAICSGSALSALPTTSNNGYTGTWSPALNNTATTTYTFTPSVGQCANTATMTVTVNQKVTPTFTQVAAICSGSALSALPTTSNNGYTGTWSPALNNTATTTYTFTPSVGQCANTATMTVTVNQKVTPTFAQVAAICSGSALSALPTISNNGFTGTWSPALNNTATTTYTFTPSVGQCANTATMSITVNQKVTPTFTQVTAICSGSALSALPTTSNNGITGTWSPALNNTTTTTYTFAPTTVSLFNEGFTANLGSWAAYSVVGAETWTHNAVFGNPGGMATINGFNAGNQNNEDWLISPAQNFTSVTGTTSLSFDTAYKFNGNPIAVLISKDYNGIGNPSTTGTWTVLNGAVLSSGNYVFANSGDLDISNFTGIGAGQVYIAFKYTSTTAAASTWEIDNVKIVNASQCANTTTMTITVTPKATPTFTQAATICSGATLSALPTTSNNGITGTWSPALNNTATTTYTFTPSVGQCANTATMTITVNQKVTPTFTQVAAICSGSALSVLPTTSSNGFTGTWSPALNNTATTTYTFTPSVGQCANTATMTITVNQPTVPTFIQVAAICSGATLAALPTTSNNGVIGTWSPAINNTTTTTYTFAPSVGQCANTATMTITVNQPTVPTFTQAAAICSGATLAALPTTSNNGVTGTWSPALNNTATTTYTFTPSVGQCANTATMSITVNQPVIPTFTQVVAICSGAALSALPVDSVNGINGSWSPALNNTATTTYTFTPSVGQCANTTTMTIPVNQPVVPTFTQVASICSGTTFALPTTSNNAITGAWSPALNNTATTTYTFTPSVGQCANMTTMTVTVNQKVTPTFIQVASICSGSALSALPTTSNNGYTGTWSPALNNTSTTTYTFAPSVGQCANTATMTITVNQPTTPTFTQVAAICSGATLAALPTTSNNGVTGTWSPALNNTATTTYTFAPSVGQCANTATMTITVNQPTTPTFTQVAAICPGAILAALPTTSNNGIIGTWSPAINNMATTTYTFTPSIGQCANTTTMTITVSQSTTPTFTAVAPICSGATLAALPTTSNNGVTGTWSPALNNTATTTYTFTPSVGQCADTATMSITVNQITVPTFTQVTAICSGATLAALPATSNNGVTGSWSPALNNTLTTTYTFAPSVGQCASIITMTITVNQPTAPTFTQVAAICSGATLAALPTTSNNGITGSWSPAMNNTATTTYIFTPSVGQCANTTTMTITVNQPTTPTFASVAPICSGATLALLPTTSNNGITGSWLPALDNTATTTYTFTPSVGQCANAATMTITVNQNVNPTFTAVAPICSGATLAALPTTSNNGITGTWSPALNNTATTIYTFTPSVGQCAIIAVMTITVNQPTAPTFTQVAPICSGATLAPLPTTSGNGITGTWSPALDNTATTNYTFTPDAGQCALAATMSITVNSNVLPTFAQVAPICSGATLSALPTTSNNGITGTWSPALDNTATTTYSFTPDAAQCALGTTMSITVNPNVTPTFTQVAAICSGAALASLPMVSDNGITGTWSPALDNTATTTYTFTPDAGQCALIATMSITVNPNILPTFTQVAPICSGETLAALPTASDNGITGTWSPALDNTATTTYTFTPDAGQCALGTTMSITVNPIITPMFTQVTPICSGETLASLPTTSNNGITGTWSPALDNTATATYTFTPDAGQCAVVTTMSITVNPIVTPMFTQVAAICSGETLASLPTISDNGITGAWSPALDNTVTNTYTFTPDSGQCAVVTTMSITVNPIVAPAFTQAAAICSGAALAALPTTSDNGITGTWSPALNNTATTAYTFTPDAGQCAGTAAMSITVNPNPALDAKSDITACVSYTLPALTNGNYFTQPGGSGTMLNAGDMITTSQTVYVYADNGLCSSEISFNVTISSVAVIDDLADVVACGSYTLPVLTTNANYYTEAAGAGTMLNAGDVITNSQTIYIYVLGAVSICTAESDFTVTINPIPAVDSLSAVAVCDSYTLPMLTDGNYYTETAAAGTMLNAGDVITSSQTIYIYATNGDCAAESDFTVTITVTPTVDDLSDVSACDSYTLPVLTNGNYYTETAGAGTMLNAGDVITSSQTIYIYATNGDCAAESDFTVTITVTPTVDDLSDVAVCDSYTLPVLTNGNYYTETAGAGTMLNAGDVITSSQTIYIYATNGDCAAESDFTVTITVTPTVDDLSDVAVCDSYTLPVLTNGNYYTETAGAGTMLNAGDVITSSQTIYIYATNGDCAAESDFTVTITVTPTVDDLSDVAVCDSYTLPVLTNGNYYTEAAGAGTMLNSGDLITSSQTIYIYATNGDCAAESDFTVTITVTPTVDDLSDVSTCDSYTLPVLTNGNYYTEAAGAGTMLNAGDVITSSQTIYIYATNGDCSVESDFLVTITVTPNVDDLSDVVANCVSYTLPTLTNGNYYTEPAGAGTMLNAGDFITTSQTIYIYASNGNCSAESSFTITINILDNSTALNLETITANQSGASYQWISCDETPGIIDGETNQSFTATANGQYAVIITMGDCSITSDCVTIDTLGKDDISTDNLITMYPNPSRGNFTVDTGDIVADSIYVIDNLGRLIVEHKPTSQKSLMDVSSYEDGVYYIRIRYQNKETVKKLILRKN